MSAGDIPSGWMELPDWLAPRTHAVLDDIQGGDPVPGLRVFATKATGTEALLVGLFEPDGQGGLRGGGGGTTFTQDTDPVQVLITIAEILQDKCSETCGGWAQARPPCPYHPHPARPAVRGGEAWWICERREERLYRVGAAEVTAALLGESRAERRRRRRRRGSYPTHWPR